MRLYGARASSNQKVFTFIKPSLLQTPTPPAKLTVKTPEEIQNHQPDKINAFNNQDKIFDFKSFKSDISQRNFLCALIVSTVSKKM